MGMEINVEKTAQGAADIVTLVNAKPLEMLDSLAGVVKNLEGQSVIQEALMDGCKKFEEGYNSSLDTLGKYVNVLKEQVPEVDAAIKKIGASLDIVKPEDVTVKVTNIEMDQMPAL